MFEAQCGKNQKFTHAESIFRVIDFRVTCLGKAMLSRNFCQKSVKVNFQNFHTVWVKLRKAFKRMVLLFLWNFLSKYNGKSLIYFSDFLALINQKFQQLFLTLPPNFPNKMLKIRKKEAILWIRRKKCQKMMFLINYFRSKKDSNWNFGVHGF